MTHPKHEEARPDDLHAEAESVREPAGGVGSTKGPVRTLCDEIGFPFDARMETQGVFVAFVAGLVAEIQDRLYIAEQIKDVTGKAPSEAAQTALALAQQMVASGVPLDRRLQLASEIHDLGHLTNPDDGPCDHDVDMLVSCASAIRFGLEKDRAWGSRHAAAAAQHVWQHVYGVSRYDRHTPAWEKAWASDKMIAALIALSAEATDSADGCVAPARQGEQGASGLNPPPAGGDLREAQMGRLREIARETERRFGEGLDTHVMLPGLFAAVAALSALPAPVVGDASGAEIEAVARALCVAAEDDPDGFCPEGQQNWYYYTSEAFAAIKALRALSPAPMGEGPGQAEDGDR